MEVRICPAEDFGDDEGTVGSDCCGEPCNQRRFFGVFKYDWHHAEGRTINKSSGEEEEQKASKEKGEVVRMNEK